jgi:hypothetical protein
MANTVADAITYARQKAQTDSNGISDTNGLAWANNGLLDITRDLIARGVDAAQVQESYTTLSASDTVPGSFAWPPDMWALKTIEIDFTDTGGQNYIQAQKLDVSNLQGKTSWDFIRSNQPTSSPLFTNHGDTGEVFPTIISGSPALVRIFYYLTPTEYSATSSTINYPQSLDYRALGDKILLGFYQSLEKFDVAKEWQTVYEKKLNDAFNILAPQSKQPIQPERLHITGFEF